MKKKSAVVCICALLSTVCHAANSSSEYVQSFCFSDDKSEVRFTSSRNENFVTIDGRNFPAKKVKSPFPQDNLPRNFLFALQLQLNPTVPTIAVIYKDRLVDDSGDVYYSCKVS